MPPCSPSAACRSRATGGGLFGLVHIDDAVVRHGGGARRARRASSTSSTTCRRRPSSGCRFVAGLLGAKPPCHVPATLARFGAGHFMIYLMCDQPAVSNQRAAGELGWEPAYPDWHEGLRRVLGKERT